MGHLQLSSGGHLSFNPPSGHLTDRCGGATGLCDCTMTSRTCSIYANGNTGMGCYGFLDNPTIVTLTKTGTCSYSYSGTINGAAVNATASCDPATGVWTYGVGVNWSGMCGAVGTGMSGVFSGPYVTGSWVFA